MIDSNPNTQSAAAPQTSSPSDSGQIPQQDIPAMTGTMKLQDAPQMQAPFRIADVVGEDGTFNEGWTSKFEGAESLGKYKSVNELINGFINANKLIGRKSESISKPGEGATQEQIQAWREHLGVPQSPEGYTVPDEYKDSYDKDGFEDFAKFAHKHNIPVETAHELMRYQESIIREQNDAFGRQIEEASKNAQEYFRKSWGAQYEKNANIIKEALQEAGIDYNDSAYAMAFNNPYILEAIYEKASKFQEGSMPSPGVMSVNSNNAKTQIMEILTKYGDITRMPGDVRDRYQRLIKSNEIQW